MKHVCKNSGSISQKRRGHVDFCAVNVQKLRHRLVSTWFQCRFDFGRHYDLVLVLRSQFFEHFRETMYRHALEDLELARSGKKMFYFFFLRKRLTLLDLFEGLCLVGTHIQR
ncbi:unnamed protein product [Laminaria digitata]